MVRVVGQGKVVRDRVVCYGKWVDKFGFRFLSRN